MVQSEYDKFIAAIIAISLGISKNVPKKCTTPNIALLRRKFRELHSHEILHTCRHCGTDPCGKHRRSRRQSSSRWLAFATP